MGYILQLETSTEICSVAISHNGVTVCEEISSRPNSHSEELTLLIKRCLESSGIKPADLCAVALSDGPGSYTSLRVGAATAKGLCFASNIPLITLGSLDILMHGLIKDGLGAGDCIACMIDARREEVYLGLYDVSGLKMAPPAPVVLDRDDFTSLVPGERTWHLCGNGAWKYRKYEGGRDCRYHHLSTSASYMSTPVFDAYIRGAFTPHKTFSPDYFKAPKITQSKKNLL